MSDHCYDVAIIGGGVVGCATVFEMTRQGFSCVLMEKNPNLMSEASAGNSGILHTGFDAPLNSVEHSCIRDCQREVFDVLPKFNVPHAKVGAVLVAWSKQQNEMLPLLRNNAHDAGVTDVEIISPSDLYKQEPFLRQEAHGALSVPGETAVDSSLLGICCAHHAKTQGASILTNCEVYGFKNRTVATSRGPVKASVTINCAGLYGDKVDQLAGINTFRIQPRKGQYCVYSKKGSNFLNSIILPVPTEKTKGVVVFNSVYNNLIVGPTAEDVPDRMRPACDPQVHKSLVGTASWMIPQLSSLSPIGQYMGVRPATQFKDYQIQSYPSRGWMTVGGIRSTGVSGSLGIAKLVGEKLRSEMGLEPSRGHTRQVESMHWDTGTDRKSVVIDGCMYQMSHPIFLYGHQVTESKL